MPYLRGRRNRNKGTSTKPPDKSAAANRPKSRAVVPANDPEPARCLPPDAHGAGERRPAAAVPRGDRLGRPETQAVLPSSRVARPQDLPSGRRGRGREAPTGGKRPPGGGPERSSPSLGAVRASSGNGCRAGSLSRQSDRSDAPVLWPADRRSANVDAEPPRFTSPPSAPGTPGRSQLCRRRH